MDDFGWIILFSGILILVAATAVEIGHRFDRRQRRKRWDKIRRERGLDD